MELYQNGAVLHQSSMRRMPWHNRSGRSGDAYRRRPAQSAKASSISSNTSIFVRPDFVEGYDIAPNPDFPELYDLSTRAAASRPEVERYMTISTEVSLVEFAVGAVAIDSRSCCSAPICFARGIDGGKNVCGCNLNGR